MTTPQENDQDEIRLWRSNKHRIVSTSSRTPTNSPGSLLQAHWTLYDDDTGQIHPHEPLEHYVPGGFHPVALGDTLRDTRYTILRKLGYGGYSTVWLASDNHGSQSSIPSRNFVSIKIKRASSSDMGLDADQEVANLRSLENQYLQGPQDKPRSDVRLLDWFAHHGPNGTHNCLVTELLGPSLSNVISIYRDLEQVLRPDTILRASRQILDGVEFTHQAGLAHGDISAANIAFTCNSILDDEDDDLLTVLGDLYVAKAKGPLPSPHVPKELVATPRWGLWNDGPEEDIRFIDWGAAFPVGQTVSQEVMPQPIDLRAPETFFIGSLSCKLDLWRAGCVIYNLVHQEPIFGARYNDKHFFLDQVIKKVGPLPEEWRSKFEEIRKQNVQADIDGELFPFAIAHIATDEQFISLFFTSGDTNGRNKIEANTPWEKFVDTFENRRQSLVSTYTDEDEEKSWKYDQDEHTDYDFECLKCLLRPMQELLRHEPESRIAAKEAADLIEWTDHRRVKPEHPDEYGGESGQEGREKDD